jgi:Polyketide cyclase / dehydrase and lipid transport
MAKFIVGLDTAATPEQARAALIDFTDRRPEIWPGLSKRVYEVYEVGETSAIVREGNDRPKVWARERYDWSRPGVIRWEVLESNFCNPGSYVQATIAPGPDGTGSHVEIEWNRTPSTAAGRFMVGFMKLFGPKILRSYVKKALDRVAAGASADQLG